jgi:hypothetical protein
MYTLPVKAAVAIVARAGGDGGRAADEFIAAWLPRLAPRRRGGLAGRNSIMSPAEAEAAAAAAAAAAVRCPCSKLRGASFTGVAMKAAQH